MFTVTGDIDEESGWMAIPSGLLSFGGLTPDEPMTVSFYRNGDAGAEGPSVAPRFNYLTNMEATDPNSGNLKLGQTKSIAELLRSMPVTDSLEHGSAPSTFTQLPWAGNGGTWSEWGWSPSSYIPGTYEADSRSGDYWNSNELDGDAMVGMTKTTGGLLSPRQFSVWLFSEAASKPSGYQLAIVGENSTEVAFILRKWVGGTETVLEEVKEVPFSEGDSIYLLAFEGKLSMWHGEGNAVPVSVGSEVADSTFTQGYSAIDGNGSNPRLIDFKTGVLSGVGTVGSLYISQTDADGGSLGPYIDTWDDSNSSPRGFLLLRRVDSPGTFAIFRVNGEIVDKGNWDELTIEHVAGNGGFSDEDRLAVEFSRTGDKGDTGPAGATGPKGATGPEGPAGSGLLDYKESARLATTENVSISTALNSGDVVDGATLANGDRVLVPNQTTKSQNGIYIVSGSPTRSTDADNTGELSGGTIVAVEQGTKYGGREMRITTAGSIIPGFTDHEWSSSTPKDFGLVEALPASSAVLVGDICTYMADKTNGVYWQLVYDGQGSYPWKKVGGSPLYSEVEAEQTTSSTSYTNLATTGPSVTLPLKGDYDIEIGYFGKSVSTALTTYMSYSIGGIGAVDADAASTIAKDQGGSMVSRPRRKTGLAASTVLTAKYKSSQEAAFLSRWMRADPVRVG